MRLMDAAARNGSAACEQGVAVTLGSEQEITLPSR